MGLRRPPEIDPETTQKHVAKLAGRLLSLISPHREGLDEFTEHLTAAFRHGVAVNHPGAGIWYSTLEVIAPEDNQVAARVRISRSASTGPRDPERGMIDLEERGRILFAEPIPVASSLDDDLLLRYSFPLVFSLEKNLKLFRKFASNELGRLRSQVSGNPNQGGNQGGVSSITNTLESKDFAIRPVDPAEDAMKAAKADIPPDVHEA